MKTFLFWIFAWCLSCFYSILDWWNGSTVDLEKGVLIVKYRYRLTNYKIYAKYTPGSRPILGRRKDHKFSLPFQPGVLPTINPETLGFESFEGLEFDD